MCSLSLQGPATEGMQVGTERPVGSFATDQLPKDLTAQVVFRNESHQRIGKDARFSDYADKNVWACLPNEGRDVRSIPEQSEESWIEAPPRVISQTKGSPTEHPRLPIEVLVMTIEKFINGLMKKKKHE